MTSAAALHITDRAELFQSFKGHSLEIRPLKPGDCDALDQFVRSLSPRSRRFRFFTPLKNLDRAQLQRLVNLDFRTRAAFAAALPGGAEILAVGRYELCESGSAEIALAVADELQGEGIGTELLHHLADHARRNGISEFTAYVLSENAGMLDVFRHSGYPMSCRFDGGVALVRLSLGNGFKPTPESTSTGLTDS